MPRVSREQTDTNRAAIEEVSSRLFRERGLKGVSVADLMAEAGLTHGGFYGHFESKDALAAVACNKAFEQSLARWHKRIAGKPDRAAAMSALVGGYLSAASRNTAGTGCPSAALAIDVAREPAEAPIRAAYRAGVKGQLGVVASLVGSHADEGSGKSDRRQALADYALMIGALILSRATAGDAISDEFLAAARERLVPAAEAPAAEAPAKARRSIKK